LCVWLPLALPTAVLAIGKTLELRLANGVFWEVLAYSLVYGGLPYSLLAVWAPGKLRGATNVRSGV